FIQRTIYTKKIDFKTQAKVSLIASLGSGFLGVLSALLSLGVWSLVIQQISRQVLLSFFLWAYSEWRPSLVFSKESFRDLFGFGIKILGANVLNTFFRNIFTFIIGKIYSTEQLGQYTRAEQFNAIFTNNFTAILQRVSFPMLSSIQDEPKRVTYMFRKSIIYSSIITFSAVLFLAAVAKPLIFLMIGEKWSNAVTYLQIMSLYAILYPLQNLNLNMLNIAGRSDIILNLEFVKKIVFIPVFIVGVYFNIKAMLWTTVIYYYLEFLLNTYYIERYFHYGVYKQVKDLIPILVISFSVSIIVWGINLFEISNVLSLTLQVLTGCLLYFFVFRLIPISEYRELKIIIKKEINKLAKI
ncbi:MAG TPA: flippase, partial [Bacteroidales bacterium]|nr:flippase [Bacteroidales bacterium]